MVSDQQSSFASFFTCSCARRNSRGRSLLSDTSTDAPLDESVCSLKTKKKPAWEYSSGPNTDENNIADYIDDGSDEDHDSEDEDERKFRLGICGFNREDPRWVSRGICRKLSVRVSYGKLSTHDPMTQKKREEAPKQSRGRYSASPAATVTNGQALAPAPDWSDQLEEEVDEERDPVLPLPADRDPVLPLPVTSPMVRTMLNQNGGLTAARLQIHEQFMPPTPAATQWRNHRNRNSSRNPRLHRSRHLPSVVKGPNDDIHSCITTFNQNSTISSLPQDLVENPKIEPKASPVRRTVEDRGFGTLKPTFWGGDIEDDVMNSFNDNDVLTEVVFK